MAKTMTKKKNAENRNYTAAELADALGVSLGQAYKIIRQLNHELEEAGYMTVAGKVSRQYVAKRWYGFSEYQQ